MLGSLTTSIVRLFLFVVCSVPQCKPAVCSVLQCNAAVCSVPQCKTAVCSVPQCDAAVRSVMHCNPAGCSPPHCDAAVCRVLHFKAALLTATASGSCRAAVCVPVAIKHFVCSVPASLATFLFLPAAEEYPISIVAECDTSEHLLPPPLAETPNSCSRALQYSCGGNAEPAPVPKLGLGFGGSGRLKYGGGQFVVHLYAAP